jgi:hypothetical protein
MQSREGVLAGIGDANPRVDPLSVGLLVTEVAPSRVDGYEGGLRVLLRHRRLHVFLRCSIPTCSPTDDFVHGSNERAGHRMKVTGRNGPERNWPMRNHWILLAALIALVIAWQAGTFDRPLSEVGLNAETCAQNLFGATVCGDELVVFCKRNYDPDINADVCDDILREEGVDPAAIARRQREVEALSATRAQNKQRTDVARGASGTLDGVEYTAGAVRTVKRVTGPAGAFKAKPGNVLIVTDIDYRNRGDKPVDVLCGAGNQFRLVDRRDKLYSADSEGMFSATANDEGCSRDVQPGQREDAQVIFQVPRGVVASELLIGEPADVPPPGDSPYLSVAVR